MLLCSQLADDGPHFTGDRLDFSSDVSILQQSVEESLIIIINWDYRNGLTVHQCYKYHKVFKLVSCPLLLLSVKQFSKT